MASQSHYSKATRRDVLLAGSGIVVASLIRPSTAFANAADEKDLIFRTVEPRNAEPALDRLVKSWITPTEHFYIRSHAPNPVIDPARFRLQIEGMVRRPMTLSLADLASYTRHQATATLTCAGNRRSEYSKEAKVGGVQWEAGAIGNAKWQGVALADVLKKAELLESAKHVWFEGLDQIEQGDGIIPFGGSIPIQKAMHLGAMPGTLLVDKMNDATLSPDHGFPLRSIVPGYIGARSVKWLGRIVVSDRPSPNHYLATAYKIVKKTETIDWAEAGPIYRFPINAAACTPAANSNVDPGLIELTGYALPTGRPGTAINRVLVSANGGDTWTKATLEGSGSEFCWQLWRAQTNVTRQTRQILVKALDSAGGFMPGRVPWNAKGYLQNSWYRLPIDVR